jgi:hypothetical protein
MSYEDFDDYDQRPRRRSKAWIFYAILTAASVVSGFSDPRLFIATPFLGLYSRYLYRGGSFVIWFF